MAPTCHSVTSPSNLNKYRHETFQFSGFFIIVSHNGEYSASIIASHYTNVFTGYVQIVLTQALGSTGPLSDVSEQTRYPFRRLAEKSRLPCLSQTLSGREG